MEHVQLLYKNINKLLWSGHNNVQTISGTALHWFTIGFSRVICPDIETNEWDKSIKMILNEFAGSQ